MRHNIKKDAKINAKTNRKKPAGKIWMRAAALGLACAFFLTGCGNGGMGEQGADEGQSAGAGGQSEDTFSGEELLSGKHHVKINIKDKGTIFVELDADSAPVTVTNFMKLAEEGFYDGLTFHRIIGGFMMQGGDPKGDGTGGSGRSIKGEFANNGVDNPLSHTRGAVSMARSQIKDSASSQFFIVHQDNESLDGKYAVFGYVTEGMEIVDDICENTTGQDGNGMVPEENRPVIESIEVVD